MDSPHRRLVRLVVETVAGVLAAGLLTTTGPLGASTPAPDATGGPGAVATGSAAADTLGAALAEPELPPVRPLPRASDVVALPRTCATRTERVPQQAMICYLTPFWEDRPTVFLWGDSHAWMLVPALRAAATGRDVNLVLSTFGGCPAMDPGLTPDDLTRLGRCGLNAYLGLRFVDRMRQGSQPLKVVIAGNWEMYQRAIGLIDAGREPGEGRASYAFAQAAILREGGPALARQLAAWDVDVDVVGQVARPPARPGPCAQGRDPYRCAFPRSQAFFFERSTVDWLGEMFAPLAAQGGLRYIDLNESLCSPYLCRGVVDGIATYLDNSHLTAAVTRHLGWYLVPSVADVADAAAPGPVRTGSGAPGTPGGCELAVSC